MNSNGRLMYKFALILSTVPSINVFRAALIAAFQSGQLDNFLICSGFFHERVNKKGAFFASDAFIGGKLPSSSEVTIVGAYDPAASEFKDFVKKLSSGLKTISGTSVPVHKRRSIVKYKNRWHAKIFIAREGAQHCFAVIGSSNLTRNAFDVAASNNEADVLIWDNSNETAERIASIALSIQRDTPPQDGVGMPTVFISNYDPGDARNTISAPMNDRLQQLWQDVLNATSGE